MKIREIVNLPGSEKATLHARIPQRNATRFVILMLLTDESGIFYEKMQKIRHYKF